MCVCLCLFFFFSFCCCCCGVLAQSQHSVVLDLLSHGVNPNLIIDNLGLSPLSVACALGDAPMAELLIKSGADIHFRCTERNSLIGYSPIHHAAGRGHADIVDLLIKSGADVNDKIPGFF